MFQNQIKMTQDDNSCFGMFDHQHNSQLNSNQNQFIHGFNLNNYQVFIDLIIIKFCCFFCVTKSYSFSMMLIRCHLIMEIIKT